MSAQAQRKADELRIEYLEIVTPFIRNDRWGLDRPQVARWNNDCTPLPIEREKLTNRFSWAIPSESALSAIAAVGPIVEIGAGSGYWAMLLRERGVDIIAYDANPPRKGADANHWHVDTPTWTEVIEGSPFDAGKHPDRTLFLCWPPMSYMAHNALRSYRGQRVIYIGEGGGGCTADDLFDADLEREWTEESEVSLPQWYGIHDWLRIYTRNAPVGV